MRRDDETRHDGAADEMPEKREPLNPADVEPVFVIGSVRSGTSIVQKALSEGAKIPGFREGHLSPLLAGMMREIHESYVRVESTAGMVDEIMIHNIPKARVEAEVLYWFGSTFLEFMTDSRWIDKTPGVGGVQAAPFLRRIFPRARFVFCLRRGIENIESRRRKFPHLDFTGQCLGWAECTKEWLRVEAELGDRSLVVRQHECATAPEKVSQHLADFLALGRREKEAMQAIFSGVREEQTGFAADHRFIDLEETPWSPEERRIFARICGEPMQAAGFSLSGGRHADPAPLRLFFTDKGEVLETECPDGASFSAAGPKTLVFNAPPGGAPLRVRYRDVPFDGQRIFRCHLDIVGPRRAQGTLAMRILDAEGRVVFEDEHRIDRRRAGPWTLSPGGEFRGPHTVELIARSTGGEHAFECHCHRAAFEI